MINKLILGTVQFGLEYGINNTEGLASKETVNEILSKAFHSGITTLDTASAYGLAEERIGNFHQNATYKFLVNSKFSKEKSTNWLESLTNSINKMNVQKLDTIMFHSFESYLIHKNEIENILKIGKSINFDNLGVSVYTNEELAILLNDKNINVIQLPFNMLDNDYKRGNIIQELQESGKEIHTRSCFLQGLFFIDHKKIDSKFKELIPFLKKIQDLSQKNNIEVGHLALQYCLNKKYIDRVLIGVDSIKQLNLNLKWAVNSIETSIFEEIDYFNIKNSDLLNPSKW